MVLGRKKKRDLGPTFSCRLTREQHEEIARIAEATQTSYAEIVRQRMQKLKEYEKLGPLDLLQIKF